MFDRELTNSERIVATYYGAMSFALGACVGVLVMAMIWKI